MQTVKTELMMDVPAATQYDPPMRGMAPFKREYCSFPPQGPNAVTQASSQSIVRFRFPNTGYLDPSKTFLRFGLQINQDSETTGTPAVPVYTQEGRLESVGASSVIQSFRVFASGQVIEDITNYADVVRLLQLHNASDHLEGMSGVVQGTEGNTVLVGTSNIPSASTVPLTSSATSVKVAYGGRIPYKNYPGKDAWRYFAIPFLASGMFGPKATDFLPLWLLGGDFEIEITFAPGTKVLRIVDRTTNVADVSLSTTAQANSYNLRDIALHTQIIALPDVFTAALLQKVREGASIKFAFQTYSVNQSSVQGSTDIVNIPVHLSDVTAIYLVRKKNTPASDYAKYQFEGDGIEYAQLQVGSNLFPQQPITNYTDLYLNLLHASNKAYNLGNPLGILPNNWGIKGDALLAINNPATTNGGVRQANTIAAFDLRKYHKSNVLVGVPLEGNATITMKYDSTLAPGFISGQVNLVIVQSTRVFILAAEGVAILR
jgi:hypothetical protein